jgi:hypothetical protein
MTKLILLVLLVSTSLYAQETEKTETTEKASVNGPALDTPALVTENLDKRRNFNARASHWLTTFGFEGMKYEVPFEFDGVKRNFNPSQQELWGGRLGLGGEIYLGAGFNTVSKLEGYYMGTLFSETLNGGDVDEDVKFAYTKRTGQILGLDISQSLGFIFDMKTRNPIMREWSYMTVEPYVEAGIGVAQSYHRINYSYELATTNEDYKSVIRDNLTNAKIGAGINFTSSSGFFFYMKATQNRYDITQRKTDLFQRDNSGTISNGPTMKDKNVKIDPITVYAIGGGYKF